MNELIYKVCHCLTLCYLQSNISFLDQQLLKLPNGRFTIVAKETLNTLKKAGAIAATTTTVTPTSTTKIPKKSNMNLTNVQEKSWTSNRPLN